MIYPKLPPFLGFDLRGPIIEIASKTRLSPEGSCSCFELGRKIGLEEGWPAMLIAPLPLFFCRTWTCQKLGSFRLNFSCLLTF